jgi:hypothetical protein
MRASDASAKAIKLNFRIAHYRLPSSAGADCHACV